MARAQRKGQGHAPRHRGTASPLPLTLTVTLTVTLTLTLTLTQASPHGMANALVAEGKRIPDRLQHLLLSRAHFP